MEPNYKLSPHFTFAEMVESDQAVRLGIYNIPTDSEVIDNLHTLASGLEEVRDALGGAPIVISSGYRSPRLNAAIRGARTSAHCYGLAADFRAPSFGTPQEVARLLAVSSIKFDQLIYEGTWVHIAFPAIDRQPRGEILTAHFSGGPVTYSKGVV